MLPSCDNLFANYPIIPLPLLNPLGFRNPFRLEGNGKMWGRFRIAKKKISFY